MAALILLDLSAAFDVIDCAIVIKRLDFPLSTRKRISLSSIHYVSDITQCLSVKDRTHREESLHLSVPE